MEWLFKLTHPSLLYTNTHLSAAFILSSIFHVILSFVLLGICASDYLCPNVATIADTSYSGDHDSRSHMRNTGALMAVLLSLCNSSPDLFSNLVSWTSSPSPTTAALSVGEVLGACGIILCVVEGSIFIIMSSTSISITKYQRLSILRDLSFTVIAMSMMCYVSFQNKVTVLNCMLMVMVYIFYLVMKFSLKQSNREVHPDTQNDGDQETTVFVDSEVILGDQQSFDSSDVTQLRTGIKPSLISAMEYSSFLSILEQSTNDNGSFPNEQEELMSLHDDNIILPDVENNRPSSTEPNQAISVLDSNVKRKSHSSPAFFLPYQDNPKTVSDEFGSMINDINMNKKIAKRKNYRKLMVRILVPHLSNYKSKSKVDRTLSLLTIPFVLLLQTSCPKNLKLLEYDKSSTRYRIARLHFLVLLLQGLVSPVISFTTLSCLMETQFPWFIWLLPVIGSLCLIILFYYLHRSIELHNKFSLLETTPLEAEKKNSRRRTLDKLHDTIQIIFLAIGIINSILFISLIANSLIEMMELYQVLTGISKAILGLTIFAWGNSISDLISNIAMCKLYLKVPHQDDFSHIQTIATKFFVISCTSCLGGVLLNSMVGIGFSGFIAMVFVHNDSSEWWFLRSRSLQEEDVTLGYNYKFVVSCLAIMVQVISLSIIFGGPRTITEWVQDRKKQVGLVMCSLWGFATICNVFIEIFG